MTTKEQNERLWRAIDNYFGLLLRMEDSEYRMGNKKEAIIYSNVSMDLFDLLKEEDLYELMKQKE